MKKKNSMKEVEVRIKFSDGDCTEKDFEKLLGAVEKILISATDRCLTIADSYGVGAIGPVEITVQDR